MATNSEQRITVLLAEDHAIVRQGLCALLVADGGFKMAGEARNGREAVEMAKTLRPDVILMDIGMPMLNGLEATRQIIAANRAAKIIVLSAHSDDAYVEQVAVLGATGFLLKQTSSHELATAIREVQKGNTFFSPSVSRRVQNRNQKSLNREGSFAKKNNRLSSREMEVLQLIAEGKPNKQVAAELGVSFKTVDKHRQNLMNKLDIHDVAGLTRYAIAEGIIESTVRLTVR